MGNIFSQWSEPQAEGTLRGSNDITHGSASKHPQVSSESDKPPPYSRAPTLPLVDRYNDPNFPKRSLRQRRSREDALETLKKYDTVLVVDDSASMRGPRWEEAKRALSDLASIAAEYDWDGLDIYFLNHSKAGLGLKRVLPRLTRYSIRYSQKAPLPSAINWMSCYQTIFGG